MTINSEIVTINRRNKEFWQNQKNLMERRMADHAIREYAFEVISGELRKNLPMYYQTPLEQALADAERVKRRFLSEQARAGGKVIKADALNERIGQIVKRRPSVTSDDLLEMLREERGLGVIEDVEEGKIFFTTGNGRSKSAKISGLKDRLSRAKRPLRSR